MSAKKQVEPYTLQWALLTLPRKKLERLSELFYLGAKAPNGRMRTECMAVVLEILARQMERPQGGTVYIPLKSNSSQQQVVKPFDAVKWLNELFDNQDKEAEDSR